MTKGFDASSGARPTSPRLLPLLNSSSSLFPYPDLQAVRISVESDRRTDCGSSKECVDSQLRSDLLLTKLARDQIGFYDVTHIVFPKRGRGKNSQIHLV